MTIVTTQYRQRRPPQGKKPSHIVGIWYAFISALALGGCAQSVWVKQGATEADFEVSKGRCMAAAYSQVPSAPTVATIGTGYQAPSFTNCSAFGNFANCVTTGGQYTPPTSITYDANSGARKQVFNGCMYSEGWSLQQQGNSASAASVPVSAWSLGFDWGAKHRECESAPPAGVDASSWIGGCQAAQKELAAKAR
jgi:hypothetical protein